MLYVYGRTLSVTVFLALLPVLFKEEKSQANSMELFVDLYGTKTRGTERQEDLCVLPRQEWKVCLSTSKGLQTLSFPRLSKELQEKEQIIKNLQDKLQGHSMTPSSSRAMSESPRSGSSASFLSDGLEGSSDMDDVSEYNCYQEDPSEGQPHSLLGTGTALDPVCYWWALLWAVLLSRINCPGLGNLLCLIHVTPQPGCGSQMEIQNILGRAKKLSAVLLLKCSAVPLKI